jgi:hypothetical protein
MFVSAVHLFISAFPVYWPRLEPYQHLDYIDVHTCPLVPGSIEAHLIDRARKTREWTDEYGLSWELIKDPNSIIDRRFMGLYRGCNIASQRTRSKVLTGVELKILVPMIN